MEITINTATLPLEGLTVNELKAEIRAHDLRAPTGLRKQDYMNILREFMRNTPRFTPLTDPLVRLFHLIPVVRRVPVQEPQPAVPVVRGAVRGLPAVTTDLPEVRPGHGEIGIPPGFTAENFDRLPMESLTIVQLQEELRNQGIDFRQSWRKQRYVDRLRGELTRRAVSNTLIRPLTGPVQNLLNQQARGEPIPRRIERPRPEQPAPGPVQLPPVPQRINWTQIPLEALSVDELREELTNQQIAQPRRANKTRLINILRDFLTTAEQPRPFSEPLHRLAVGQMTRAQQRRIEVERNRAEARRFRREVLRERLGEIGIIQLPPVPQREREERIPIDQANPYMRLNSLLLDEIVTLRDVDIGRGTFHERARNLLELDQILPEWIETIRQTSISQINRLSTPQIYLYGALRGITMTALIQSGPSRSDLVEIVTALSMLTQIGSTQPPVVAPTPEARKVTENNPTFEGGTGVARTVVTSPYELLGQVAQGEVVTLVPTRNLSIDLNIAPDVARKLVEYPITVSPENYLILRRLRENNLRKAVDILFSSIEYPIRALMPKEDLIFVLSRGYLPSLEPEFQRILTRYHQLNVLTGRQKSLLVHLYHVTDVTDPIVSIVNRPIVPMEEIILLIDKHPVSQLASAIGMTIPPNVDVLNYFTDNLLLYNTVLNRPGNVRPLSLDDFITSREPRRLVEIYTDMELFQALGAYVGYTGRADLLEKIINLRTYPGFFIPLERRCRNKETLLYNNTNDPNLFVVSYGTLTNYLCYELAELQNAFHYRTDAQPVPLEGTGQAMEDDFLFLHPEDIRQTFLTPQIEELLRLLQNYNFPSEGGTGTGTNDVSLLIRRIEEGLAANQRKTQYDRRVLGQFRRLTTPSKQSIHDWLYQLFYTAMYMRRWEGPGYPYPLTEAATKKNIDPEKRTLPALEELYGIYEKMTRTDQNFISQLHTVEYYQKNPEQSTVPISQYLNGVRRGDYCIRMGSTKFIGTAYYYLQLFFNETIPNFDLNQLTHIV